MNAALPQPPPVPQALYMNTRSLPPQIATSQAPPQAAPPVAAPPPLVVATQVRPQALYVNVNNQMIPMTPTVTLPNTATTVNTSSFGQMTTPQMTTPSSQIIPPRQTLTSGQVNGTIGGTLQLMTSGSNIYSLNNQPVHAQAPTTAIQSVPLITRQPIPPPPKDFVFVNAFQIRIGTKRFAPAASVQFKEEGVLFTLKEHLNAPLLLNARAILQCQANLNTGSFPAFFFFLESSCVKQIRSIFNIRESEFQSKTEDETLAAYCQKDAISRCISIFPHRLETTDVMNIKHTFSAMQQKFSRKEGILKSIDAKQVIDFLYGAPVGIISQGGTSSPAVNGTATTAIPANQPTMQSMQTTLRNAAPRQQPPPVTTLTTTLTNGDLYRSLAPLLQNNQVANAQVAPASQPPDQVPTLVIPQDQNKWEMMKRKLVNGGVYQVQTPDGARKYCVWNGVSLMPCLEQDREIQLNCTHIRIGNMKMAAAGKSLILNTEGSRKLEVRFHWNNKTMAVTIPFVHIANASFVYGHVNVLFLQLSSNFATYIKNTLVSNTHPAYDYQPKYADSRPACGYFVIFLQDFNQDQREALLRVQINSKKVFSEIAMQDAVALLEAIRTNTTINNTQAKKYTGIGISGNYNLPSVENLLLEVRLPLSSCNGPVASRKRGYNVIEDDDDDDVVITQKEIGIKCPYTQKDMEDPVKNRNCGHNYEKAAIMEFIGRKQMKNSVARCPWGGCGNATPLKASDLEPNIQLREHIKKKKVPTATLR